jgi:hypothetical protein
MAYDPRPPEVIQAAATLARWLDQPPVRATEEQFAKMNAEQRIDYCRQFVQPTLDDGKRR